MYMITTFIDFENINETNNSDIEKHTKIVDELMKDIENRFPVNLFIYYSKFSQTIILSQIVIDKNNRSNGVGTEVMNEICECADKYQLRIGLTPSSDFGGNKARLIKFYKNFGFIKYKGFEFKETMVRLPQ